MRPEGHLIAESEEILNLINSQEETQEKLFDEEVNADTVNSALLEIDEKYRSVLILRFFEHREYDDISDILRIPVGSVGTLIHRGKSQLKKKINPEKISV